MDQDDQQHPSQFVISARFDEFSQFEEAIRDWDLDFLQLDCGSFEAEVTQLVTPSVLMSAFGLSRRLEQHGGTPGGYRSFGIPAADAPPMRWRGKTLCSENLMLFPPGAELDCVSEPGFNAIGLSVSEKVLEEIAARRGIASVEELFPDDDTVRCDPLHQQRLRDLALRLIDAAAEDPAVLNNPWYRVSLEEHLVETLLSAIDSSQPMTDQRPMSRIRRLALRKALDVIAEYADQPLAIAELERLSGTSGRTLRYAFQEEFGVPPVRYLHAYRLNRIHRRLDQNQTQGLTVAEVAKAGGVWHMGQFSADYHKMFGKLPSHTLAR